MRSPYRFTALTLCALAALLAAAPAGAAGSADKSLDSSLRFGYDLRSGAVAIDPAVIYVYCPATDTLVVNAEHAEETAKELGAQVLSDGRWSIGGRTVTPQIARLQIATPGNGAEVMRQLDRLEAVSAGDVVIAEPAEPACTTKLQGYKCKTYDCSGCSNGVQQSGGSVTYCDKSTVATDTCTQTGGFKTCVLTTWEKANCSGAVIQSTVINYNSCS